MTTSYIVLCAECFEPYLEHHLEELPKGGMFGQCERCGKLFDSYPFGGTRGARTPLRTDVERIDRLHMSDRHLGDYMLASAERSLGENWTSVSDAYPPTDHAVLVWSRLEFPWRVAYYDGSRWRRVVQQCGCTGREIPGVTHWMPLPVPPPKVQGG
jgi:hypothetical protein